ncbi:MAG: hypothetical protein KDH15_20625 [Rhodocyclaceae bacterium]|nr:hypothetical protein [Rhodocyclaceae bacterium]
MSMRALPVPTLLLLPILAIAACPPTEPVAAADIALHSPAALIVTHASTVHDPRMVTRPGLDAAIALARARGLPVVQLQDDGPAESYFAGDCAADFRVRSQGGELGFEVPDEQVLSVGGHLEMCLSTTWHEILLQWARRPPHDRVLTIFMDAIYSNGKGIDETSRHFDALARFMGVVTYGRPGGESWPKLSLLETLGVIIDPQGQRDYLAQVLPNWARTMPDTYRVEMWLDGELARVLRAGGGSGAPTLVFDFRDSAMTNGFDDELTGRRPGR